MVVALAPKAFGDFVIGPACHEGAVRGMGNPTKGVMIVGIAPGKDEMRLGKPLVGPTGKLFDQILAAVGLPRTDVYVTNMVCKYIPGKITQAHLSPCVTRLEQEIAQVQPRLIITLGTEVCQWWTGKPISKARGAVLWNERYRCWVMPMIQPAALFHDGSTGNAQTDKVSNTAYDIVRDLRKVPDVLTWPDGPVKAHVEYKVLETSNEAQHVLDTLPKDIPVAVDVETNAKVIDLIDIQRDDLICIAISTGDMSWVGTKEVWEGCTWPMDVQYTFHHGVFDTAVIQRKLGVVLPIVHDTMLKSYSCDERPGYHALKPLAREFEGCGFYEEDRAKGLQELMVYNAKDSAYTQRLCVNRLETWQQEEGTKAVYDSLLIPAINCFKEIQARGARVDAELLRELEKQWGDEKEAEQERMQQLAYQAGWLDDNINLNSWQQLSKLLYQVIGLPGGPSTNKEALEQLRGLHPFVDALLEYRHLEHNYGIYIDGWVKHIRVHGVGHGRVHPWAKLHGTATGRRSYSEPAVQTIPRPSNSANKYGRLRQAIIPTSDEYEIAYADYSRAEIFTAYGYSRDPIMWEALQKDYHLETAVNVMKKDRAMMMADDNYREEMRRIAKIVTFGILYGMEPYSLSLTAGITYNEAAAYITGFFETNSKYTEFYNETLAELQRTGEVVSITGRKRRFVLIQDNPRALKQAVNFPIQSTAGDVTLQALIKLHHLLKQYDSYVLFDVHDAIVFEVAKRYRREVMHLIRATMEAAPFPELAPDFPCIPTEAYIGKSWGHAQKIKDYNALVSG